MNNFDISSTGENIEFFVGYDTQLSQMYFSYFKEGKDGNEVLFFGDNSYCVIGDNSKKYYKKSVLHKMNKAELLELAEYYDIAYGGTKKELIDLLADVSYKQFYTMHFDNKPWNNLDYDYISRGYSQGDSVKIKFIDCQTEFSEKYIDNLFWDSPIYINATVGEKEFFEDDFLDDQYEYDKAAVAEKINGFDISDYAKKYLIKHLPEQPQYK